MIRIKQNIVEAIRQQGLQEAPLEACGYLAGKQGSVTTYYPMLNVDQSEEHFSLDPMEQFAVVKKIREEGLELIAVYHTHPASSARPSKEDIKLAYDPNISYVIASLHNGFEIQSFKIRNGKVEPEELEFIHA